MPSAKSIIHKIINKLQRFSPVALVVFFLSPNPVFAQDNSPYSRYGIGDLVPQQHITSRSMGGVSAGYTDFLSINFSNPASFSSFQSIRELKSKKLVSGRAILDVGVNIDNRTLREDNPVRKFPTSNALFSYVQVGVPLKSNWGLNFGLRPVSRISYNIFRNERLKNPLTGATLDSATTTYKGDGGAYLASVGTGFSLFDKTSEKGEHKLSVGLNAGYYFGSKDYSSRRFFNNDTVDYYSANYQTRTNFGSMFFSAGMQYKVPVGSKTMLTLGAFGNWGQKINASQDVLRETYIYNENQGNLRLDSVSDRRDVKGKIELPASYTFGFVLQKMALANKEGGWMFGVDYTMEQWDKYRFYGQRDSVQNSWMLKLGAQINPTPKRNYFSNVAYRFGFFTGPDYIRVGKKMTNLGASFGMGLPVAISRQAPNQVTLINLAFEWSKRGNSDNLLRENFFKIGLGLSLSDFWFIKRKYE